MSDKLNRERASTFISLSNLAYSCDMCRCEEEMFICFEKFYPISDLRKKHLRERKEAKKKEKKHSEKNIDVRARYEGNKKNVKMEKMMKQKIETSILCYHHRN